MKHFKNKRSATHTQTHTHTHTHTHTYTYTHSDIHTRVCVCVHVWLIFYTFFKLFNFFYISVFYKGHVPVNDGWCSSSGIHTRV